MVEVYSNTLQGLIWLGEADNSTEKALESIKSACAEAYAETKERRHTWARMLGISGLGMTRETLGFTPDFAALAHLFRLPWFCRRWVIQEAFLAPSSQCIIGDFEISWADTLRGTIWISHKARLLSGAVDFLRATLRIILISMLVEQKQSGSPIGLENFMRSSAGSKVEDERDTVYALLGLWLKLHHQTKLHPLLAPDYNKSPDAAICDATRYIAAVEMNLTYLQSIHHRVNSDPLRKKLPSWAASWHGTLDLTCNSPDHFGNFNADGWDVHLHFRPPSGFSSRVLSVRGKGVEPVRAVTKLINRVDTPGYVLAKLRQVEKASSSFAQQASELDSFSRLGKVLIAGTDHLRKPATEDFSSRGYVEWLKYLHREDSWPPHWRMVEESEAATLGKAAEYDGAFRAACRYQVLFVTASGRLGVGPRTLKEDDLVAILYGCNLPVILRRYPDSDLHEFVGVAYVEGIMFGEAVDGAKTSFTDNVTFHLQ